MRKLRRIALFASIIALVVIGVVFLVDNDADSLQLGAFACFAGALGLASPLLPD